MPDTDAGGPKAADNPVTPVKAAPEPKMLTFTAPVDTLAITLSTSRHAIVENGQIKVTDDLLPCERADLARLGFIPA